MWEWPLPVVLQTLQCHFEAWLIPWENICHVKVLSCKSWVGPAYLYLLTCLFCVTSNIFKISHLWCSFTRSISIFKGALCDPAKWFPFYLKWLASLTGQIDACPRLHCGKSHKCPKYTRGTTNRGQPITDKMVGGYCACNFNDPISWLQLRPPTGEEGELHLHNLNLHFWSGRLIKCV